MTTRELKCEERIDNELRDRESYLSEMYQASDLDGEDSDNARESINEMAYGIDTTQVTRVTWSGGGPADFIEIFHNKYGVERVEYVYQDWYDGARRTVDEDTAIYRYALEILDMLDS